MPRLIEMLLIFLCKWHFCRLLGKFSISPACIRKIPLNPPLQKGEAVGMPRLIEMLPYYALRPCNTTKGIMKTPSLSLTFHNQFLRSL
jgi:hypothetical protein